MIQAIIDTIKAVISMRMLRIRLYLRDRNLYIAYRDYTEPIFIENPSAPQTEFESGCYGRITAEIAKLRAFGIPKRYLKTYLKRVVSQTETLEMQTAKIVRDSRRVRL